MIKLPTLTVGALVELTNGVTPYGYDITKDIIDGRDLGSAKSKRLQYDDRFIIIKTMTISNFLEDPMDFCRIAYPGGTTWIERWKLIKVT